MVAYTSCKYVRFKKKNKKTYNLYFGNVNETSTAPQMAYFFIFTVFISIVMFNLLITIINETFGRVSDNNDYYESQAKISLVVESITA